MELDSPGPALDRLYGVLRWSLPVYLQDSHPWRDQGNEVAYQRIEAAAVDFFSYAERLAATAQELRWPIAPGGFPLRFTGLHECCATYLAGLAAERLKAALPELHRCVDSLGPWPAIQALAEEVLGNTRGHMEQLEQAAAETP